MFATYEEAMEWIHTRKGMGPKPGIVRMKWLMEKLDHPERKFRSIHIAGTNGKGVECCLLKKPVHGGWLYGWNLHLAAYRQFQ